MKYFVIIATLCTYVLSETLQEHSQNVVQQIMTYGAECAEKLGATSEDMEKLMKHQLPENKAGVCVISCVNKKFGLQNPDGAINKGSKLESVEQIKDIDADVYNKMSSVWNTCSSIVENDSDECNTGANLIKCMREEKDKAGLTKETLGL